MGLRNQHKVLLWQLLLPWSRLTHTHHTHTVHKTKLWSAPWSLQPCPASLPGKLQTPPTSISPGLSSSISHDVQMKRTVPDWEAWVEKPAPPLQGAGTWVGSERTSWGYSSEGRLQELATVSPGTKIWTLLPKNVCLCVGRGKDGGG